MIQENGALIAALKVLSYSLHSLCTLAASKYRMSASAEIKSEERAREKKGGEKESISETITEVRITLSYSWLWRILCLTERESNRESVSARGREGRAKAGRKGGRGTELPVRYSR